MDRLTLIGEDGLEQGAPLAGLGGSFGAEPPVDEGLLLQTLLLPAGGLVGSGSARERQLALHKWAVSLAGLQEEAVIGIRKIHRAKAVMNEQKMQEQTRLLDQLKLLLRAAKGSLDGHLAALTDLIQDATVLLQELAQAVHDLHHVSPESWERLRERYDRMTRRRACLEADVASRDFFSFYSPDKANPLAAVAQVRKLEAELAKAKGRERALEARLQEQQRANSGLRASIAAFGGAGLRRDGERLQDASSGVEGEAGAALDGAFDAALRAYEDKCHKELAAAKLRAGLCSTGSPGAPAPAPAPAPASEPAAAGLDGGDGPALAAAALDKQYRSAFRRMLESVQRIHVREKEMIVKQADQEKEKQLRLVENQMSQTLERFMDGRQAGFGTLEGGGSSHPGTLSGPIPSPSRQTGAANTIEQSSSGTCSETSQHTSPSDRSLPTSIGPGGLTTPKARAMAPEDIADIALAISSSATLQGGTIPGNEADRLKDLPPEVLAAAAKAAADSSTKMVDTILNREGELYESVRATMSTQELLDKIQSESAEDAAVVPRPRQSSPKPTISD